MPERVGWFKSSPLQINHSLAKPCRGPWQELWAGVSRQYEKDVGGFPRRRASSGAPGSGESAYEIDGGDDGQHALRYRWIMAVATTPTSGSRNTGHRTGSRFPGAKAITPEFLDTVRDKRAQERKR